MLQPDHTESDHVTADCPSVDVVLPLYGDHSTASLEVVIESLLMQLGVKVSVVVAHIEDCLEVRRTCDHYNVKSVSVSASDAISNGRFVPAAFRNAAIKTSHSQFVYNGDSDVVYLSPTYFADLLAWSASNESPCVFGPPMRRMPVDVVPRFLNLVHRESLNCALGQLLLERPFLATLEPNSHRTIVFRDNPEAGLIGRESEDAIWLTDQGGVSRSDRLIVYLENDFIAYRSTPQNIGKEPYFCTQDVHCGGTLVPRQFLLAAGAFSSEYAGWGCHDADLQAKLGALTGCALIPRITRFCVLHLDHARAYFDESQWNKNRQTLSSRCNSIDLAIANDRRIFKELKSDF